MAKARTYRWINYDVWGNDEDGFEVNDKSRTSFTIEVSDPNETSDNHIIKLLVEAGVFNEQAFDENIEIEDDYGDESDETRVMYFTDGSTGRPLGELVSE